MVTTKEGKYRVGVLKRETDKELELLNPDLEPEKQRIVIRRTTSRPATAAPPRCPRDW